MIWESREHGYLQIHLEHIRETVTGKGQSIPNTLNQSVVNGILFWHCCAHGYWQKTREEETWMECKEKTCQEVFVAWRACQDILEFGKSWKQFHLSETKTNQFSASISSQLCHRTCWNSKTLLLVQDTPAFTYCFLDIPPFPHGFKQIMKCTASGAFIARKSFSCTVLSSEWHCYLTAQKHRAGYLLQVVEHFPEP